MNLNITKNDVKTSLADIGRSFKEYGADLRPDIRRITGKNRYGHLLSPITVGGIRLSNRMMTTSMSPGRGYTDAETHKPTQMFLNYLEERAAGGFELICQTVMMYPQTGVTRHPVPWAFSDEYVPGLSSMAEVVHRHGSHLVGQIPALNNWRPTGSDREEAYGPSDITIRQIHGQYFVPMSKEQIPDYIAQAVNAASILKKSGWDGVELVAGAGGTLNRFLSKATNNRTDEYGGSAENRCRLLLEMCAAIKEALPGFPVFLRWSPIDLVPGGNEIGDAHELAKYIDRAGFGYINVQIGWHESSVPTTTKEIKDGYWSWVSAELKKVCRTPIVTGYRETDPDVMERILAEGRADMIGGLRYSLADPEFPRKLREGREKEIRRCICCCRCLDDMAAGRGQEYCSVNPGLGPELLTPLVRAAVPKRVMVIGSGPAGLSAALTAAKEGHNVTLFERGPRIGGCLVLSSVFSPMYERLIKYYKAVLPSYKNLKIKLNTTVTAGLVRDFSPDAVIVAVGGEAADGGLPGIENGNVVLSHDLLELLNGRPPQKPGIVNKVMWNAGYVFLHFIYSPRLVDFVLRLPSPWPVGKNVAVVGGGLPGCEMGMKLKGSWRKLDIFEEGKIGFDVGSSERFIVRNAFKTSDDIEMYEKYKVVSLTNSGVYAVDANGEENFFPADTVAVTLGFEENRALYEEIKALAPQVLIAGDCNEPKRMPDATKAGYRAAMQIK